MPRLREGMRVSRALFEGSRAFGDARTARSISRRDGSNGVALLFALSFSAAAAACGGTDPSAIGEQSGGNTGTATGGAAAGSTPGSGGSTSQSAGSGSGGATSAGGGTGAAGGSMNEALLPWHVGNTWTYLVTDPATGVTSIKTTTIEALSAVGGTGPHGTEMAYHVITRKGQGALDKSESWQLPLPGNHARIVRYRELSFSATTGLPTQDEHWDPHKLHIDGSPAKLIANGSWLEAYTETKLPVGQAPNPPQQITDRWSVISLDEATMAAGTPYPHTVHFRKVGTSTKEYWYARGIGKVKETGTQLEELTAFTIVGQVP